MRSPRGAKVRVGGVYRMWQLPGKWYAWSDGPEQGSYWVMALDAEAREVVDTLTEHPDWGDPVVIRRSVRAIAVKTKQLKPQALEQ